MKRIWIITLIVLVSGLLFSSYSGKTSLTKENLKGKVKTLILTKHYVLDSLGVIKKGKVTENKFILNYNEKGNITNRTEYGTDGKLTSNRIYKYDEKGNEIERYDSVKKSRTTFVYDDKGRKIESLSGRTLHKFKYKYNQSGIMIECSEYNSDSTLYSKEEYNVKGQLTKRTSYSNGKSDGESRYKYDVKGNEIEFYFKLDTFFLIESTSTYKYTKFDNLGNWISQTEYQGGSPSFIHERVIEYYK